MLDNSNLRFLLISANRHYTAGQGIVLWQDPRTRNIQYWQLARHLEEIFNTHHLDADNNIDIDKELEIFNTDNSLTTWTCGELRN